MPPRWGQQEPGRPVLMLDTRIRGEGTLEPTGAYGTALWATERELERARLLGDRGSPYAALAYAAIELRQLGRNAPKSFGICQRA